MDRGGNGGHHQTEVDRDGEVDRSRQRWSQMDINCQGRNMDRGGQKLTEVDSEDIDGQRWTVVWC